MGKKTAFALVPIVSVFVILFVECLKFNSPPSITAVQQDFKNNYSAIRIIVEFITSEKYENVYILEANGVMRADFANVQIENNQVVDAIKQILENGNYKSICKRGNTIYLLQWKGVRDIGCGIAYSINGIDLPNIEYMTQCSPLDKDNWYYYVSDYNSWRNQQG